MAVKNTLANKQKNPLEITFKSGENDVRLSPETVKKYLVSGDASKVTTQEIVMFINLCKFQHLNPFLREAYLIKYGDQPATLVVGKTAFEKRAFRCEKYRGFDAGVMVIHADGTLEKRTGTLVLQGEELVGGWAEIYVDGFQRPVTSFVSFSEYAGRKKDGSLNAQWASKPATMIRKVAKAQALREAFPEDFAGMYIAEESGIADPLPEIPVEQSQSYAEEVLSEEPIQEASAPQDDFARILEG